MIDKINKERKGHIITVEDPIEFIHRHQGCIVNQREVGTDTKSFQRALKYALREDPDVDPRRRNARPGDDPGRRSRSPRPATSRSRRCTRTRAAEAINRIIDVFPRHQQSQVRAQLAFVLEGDRHADAAAASAKGRGRAMAAEILVVTPAIRALIRDDKIHQIYSIDAVRQEVRHADDERRAVPAVHERARWRWTSACACRGDPNEFLRMIGDDAAGRWTRTATESRSRAAATRSTSAARHSGQSANRLRSITCRRSRTRARTLNGELKNATIDAPNRDEVDRAAAAAAAERRQDRRRHGAARRSASGAIKMRDIVIFTRQFSTMINAGLPLVQALDILAQAEREQGARRT